MNSTSQDRIFVFRSPITLYDEMLVTKDPASNEINLESFTKSPTAIQENVKTTDVGNIERTGSTGHRESEQDDITILYEKMSQNPSNVAMNENEIDNENFDCIIIDDEEPH